MVENTISMSLSGGIVGTPGYIAPEVWESNSASPPVDIYALGCVVYEILTGDVLFKGQTPLQAVYAHSRGPQFPSTWPDDVPPGITTVLAKALARDPSARYVSAGALWQALYQLNSQLQTAPESAKPSEATSHVEDAKRIEIVQQEGQPSVSVREGSKRAEAAQHDAKPAEMSHTATSYAEEAKRVEATQPERIAATQETPKLTEATSHTAIPRVEDALRVTTTQAEPKRVELTQTAEPRAPIGTLNAAELVLILLAIMIDIGGGQLSKALQLPLWIDSIGTVLAGALLGPWIGAITGVLAHSLWGFSGLDQLALWFTPVTAVCGLLAGFAGRLGAFQRPSPRWLGALIGGVFLFALTMFVFMYIYSTDEGSLRPVWPVAGDLVAQYAPIFVAALVLGTLIGYFALGSAGYAGVAGLIMSVPTALIAAPIAAYVFGGGSGIDTMVEAFRNSSWHFWAITLGQNTVVESFDKLTVFLIVYLVIHLLPQRLLRQFRNTHAAADGDIER
jgi:hypothetical protein